MIKISKNVIKHEKENQSKVKDNKIRLQKPNQKFKFSCSIMTTNDIILEVEMCVECIPTGKRTNWTLFECK